jgi:cell pole-organizing protein PopZ
MTRPQFAGEPSMEDILTSIRKMISEEPTGPRPIPDQIGRTVFSFSVPEAQQPANEPQQGSLEDNITRLLNERSGPAQAPLQNSRPLATFSRVQDLQPAADAPGRGSDFDKPASQANDATVPFGHRAVEGRPFSTDKTGSTNPSLDRPSLDRPSLDRNELSVGAAGPFGSGAVGLKSDVRSALTPKDTIGTKPGVAKVSSLVANLEKARASAASEARGKKVEDPLVADAPAPEAVAAALLDKSGAQLSNGDVRPPAANGATISILGSQPVQSEAFRVDASKHAVKRAGDIAAGVLDSGILGDAVLRSLRNSETNASVRAAAKPGSAAPPSEVLLDAVVDLVKNDPSSLSVFTSGASFVNGVTGGEKSETSAFTSGASFVHGVSSSGKKPDNSAAPPRKLDTAASELIRPMLRQWLSENMPRIVEEALRSELDSSETTGEGTDKA